MIAYLRGSVLEKEDGRLVIDAGGVGYEVAVNASTASRLPNTGAEGEVFVNGARYVPITVRMVGDREKFFVEPVNRSKGPEDVYDHILSTMNAPNHPSRQCASRKLTGERHLLKQVFLSGVSWYTPAATMSPPTMRGQLVMSKSDRSASRSSPAAKPNATTPSRAQTSM